MFSFRKTDTEKLLGESLADVKRLETAEAKKTKLRPQWEARHAECVRLAIEVEIGDKTWSKITARRSDPITKDAIASAKAQLEQAIKDRDDVFEPVLAEIENVEKRIFRRGSILAGAFGSWSARIYERLADGDQKQKLLNARREAESLQQNPRGMQRMIDVITATVEEFEANEQIDIPLFRFAETVRKALAVE